MADVERKRILLNRVEADGLALGEAAKRVREAPGVRLLRENSPTSLLIEGGGEAIDGLVSEMKGWSAHPSVSYPLPDARARPLKPPS